MGSEEHHEERFGWADVIAAVIAVGLVTLAMPGHAADQRALPTTTHDDDDWNFLWIAPSGGTAPEYAYTSRWVGRSALPFDFNAPGTEKTLSVSEFAAPTESATGLTRRIEQLPIGVRFTPPVAASAALTPSVTMREDRWTMVDVDGVARVAAYARGTIVAEDMELTRTPTPFPKATGTGFSFVTNTPVYVGATMKTDRSVYDIEPDRFRGARWATSVFLGTDTAFGPLYLGTTQEQGRARSTYLYLGRWF